VSSQCVFYVCNTELIYCLRTRYEPGRRGTSPEEGDESDIVVDIVDEDTAMEDVGVCGPGVGCG
jgi:hypothetical protein